MDIKWISLFFVLSLRVAAQDILIEVPLTESKIDSISTFIVGDSLLIKYKDSRKVGARFKYQWVNPRGNIKPIPYQQNIIAVGSTYGALNLYYLEKIGESLLLKELTQHGRQLKMPAASLIINDQIIGGFVEDGLYHLLTLNAPKRRIELIRMQGIDSMKSTTFNVPEKFVSPLKRAGLQQFHIEGSLVNFFGEAGPVKFFKKGESLLISVDHQDRKESYVDVLTLNLENGTIDVKSIPLGHDETFRSFIEGNKLYTYSHDTKAPVAQVFSLTNANQIDIDSVVKYPEKFKYMSRIGRGATTLRVPVDFVTMDSYTPYISAFVYGGVTYLRCGRYWPNYSKSGIMPLGVSPALSLIVFAATTAIRVSGDPNGKLDYIYFSDKENVLSFEPNANHIFQKIDDHEINVQSAGLTYSQKIYLPWNNGIMAVYKMKKAKSIQFCFFK